MSGNVDTAKILAELSTDVKHILKHIEKQNGRVSKIELEVHKMEIEQTKIKTQWTSFVVAISTIASTTFATAFNWFWKE